MRLIHYSRDGGEIRTGLVVRDDVVVDLAEGYARVAPEAGPLPSTIDGLLLEGLLEDSRAGVLRIAVDRIVDEGDGLAENSFDIASVRLHSPVLRPPKIIGVGLNYADHAQEAGMELPPEPVFFSKFASAVTGPNDPIRLPMASSQIDWEAELVVIVGRGGHAFDEAAAPAHIAGYTVGNDVTARDWQLKKPLRQWLLGKSFDTFLPMGPALVTSDEISDPYALQVRCDIDGSVMQDAPSAMHFRIPYLLSYLSNVVSLEPGDVILTGTPAGIGLTRDPSRFLHDGELLTTSIESIGQMANPIVGPSAPAAH